MKGNSSKPGFLEGIFTRQERLALAFVAGISLVGMVLLACRCIFPPAPPAFIRLEVHVNRADATELASLPGIGPVLARRIVEDRLRHGRYLTLQDLARVKGVSSKVLTRLNGLVRFD